MVIIDDIKLAGASDGSQSAGHHVSKWHVSTQAPHVRCIYSPDLRSFFSIANNQEGSFIRQFKLKGGCIRTGLAWAKPRLNNQHISDLSRALILVLP